MDDEFAYAIIEPHFDAVRDHYARFEPSPGEALGELKRTRLLIDPAVRNSERHYAACRDDGLLVVVAPQAAELPHEQLVALLCHELGHAADFLYPARFGGRRGERALWLPDDAPKMARIRRAWADRTDDQVEWDADSIAYLVAERPITYCGPCLIQCFGGGVARPRGLR